jgi:malonate-semialdehyde dehydrogenase (acetylating)/methylmalonate-semialdehyde dehydrogenase
LGFWVFFVAKKGLPLGNKAYFLFGGKVTMVLKPERFSNPVEILNLVGGQWIHSKSQTKQILKSPYDQHPFAVVSESTQEDISLAVLRAGEAFESWQRTPIKERCQILLTFRQLVLDQRENLARGISAESGKTPEEALQGLMKGLEVTEFAISLQNLSVGQKMEVSRGVSCEMRREPLGVVVGITPFNFPAMVPLWMFPIALALGNCFILKPSEKVPLTSQRLGDLLTQAGLPPGVFSVVNGGRSTVDALITHPEVQAVAFVGSTPVAQSLYQKATALGKRALCLGGAKNLLMVVPDADPEVIVPAVVQSFTGCAGQRCMAGSILVAVGPVDSLIDQIVVKTKSIQCGIHMGALIDTAARTRILGIIERALGEGAKLLLDGRSPNVPDCFKEGQWLAPTILDQVLPHFECAQTEIFGPVLSIIRVETLSEALALDRRLPYGNATSIFTTSGAIADQVAQNSPSGMIGINVGVPVPREPFSFGGTKRSKFGQGDITGESSLEFWTSLKKITTKWSLQKDQNWMS